MIWSTRRPAALLALVLTLGTPAMAQTPVPFPKPGQPSQPSAPKITPPPAPSPQQAPAPARDDEPSEATLGAPIYPGAQFIASYDAGGAGQRFHLFGTNASYVEIVAYYKKILRKNGDELFDAPGVHMFETARFREETMAFPPSVTVKDYSTIGSGGYLNPKRGAQPARFRTIIQIVPAPFPSR